MAVVTHPVPTDQIPPTEEGRNEFPPFKAKKWALQATRGMESSLP